MIGSLENTPLALSPHSQRPKFTNSSFIIFATLGSLLGTGNLWRFSRASALGPYKTDSLVFLLVWLFFVLMWTVPMSLLELGLGRLTKLSGIETFRKILGERFTWCGLWINVVAFFSACTYSSLVGWSLYYAYRTIAFDLPVSETDSFATFRYFTEDTYWPFLTQVITIALSGLAVKNGIRTLEMVNMFVVPVLLCITVASLMWALTRPYAVVGLKFLFTPHWESFRNPDVWVHAISENAYNCGVGLGLLAAYSVAMTKSDPIVKYGVIMPIAANFVCLLCAMTIFAIVFSAGWSRSPAMTEGEILTIISKPGPCDTGMTFIWLPVFFSAAGQFGRALCLLSYISVFIAGLTTLMAFQEMLVLPLVQFGMRRSTAILLTNFLQLVIGLPSSFNVRYLESQIFVWRLGVIMAGILLQTLVFKYGAAKFRREAFIEYSLKDWPLPELWDYVIQYALPIQSLVLVLSSIMNVIAVATGEKMWFTSDGDLRMWLATAIEWVAVFLLCIIMNCALHRLQPAWYQLPTGDYIEDADLIRPPSYDSIFPPPPSYAEQLISVSARANSQRSNTAAAVQCDERFDIRPVHRLGDGYESLDIPPASTPHIGEPRTNAIAGDIKK